ncbi:hypothetical protein SAMN05444008_10716 [Cnuella takakiae]|uniref:Acyl-coenzyme A thioesterase PaaI, contains HGG motif n=2 Tax=Cnuella takakiae TaxID=1302690 RepID=A0A1M5AUN7_9BACT|nr:hypothetical protein SAMN05444008_10716 [Cnuella takakiae]
MIRKPVKLRVFLLQKLPAAYFSGLRVVSATETVAAVSVPYKWFTQNPFRSTYFACLAMGAELSTGILAMAQTWGRNPPISMLVTGVESRFYKKVTGITLFTCSEGSQVKQAVVAAHTTGLAQTVKVRSEGKSEKGELVAEFWFEWSFKAKSTAT